MPRQASARLHGCLLDAAACASTFVVRCPCTPEEGGQLHCGNDPSRRMDKAMRAAGSPTRCLGLARGEKGGVQQGSSSRLSRCQTSCSTCTPPRRRAPLGEFLTPLIMCHMLPPHLRTASRVIGADGGMHEQGGVRELGALRAGASVETQRSPAMSQNDSRSHAEGAANVVDYPVWTGFSSVIDAGRCRFA